MKKLKSWFGDSSSDDSNSDSSEEEASKNEEQWQTIDRKKRNKIKKENKKKNIKHYQAKTASKASCIIGLGPITAESIKHFEDITDNYNIAKEQAVIKFLKFYLKYDNTEIEDINIVSTQTAPKDDIIYVALDNTKNVKDIYKKIAQVKHPEVTTRNFIPPQFYARHMYLSKVCKHLRDTEKETKTQIRFGKTDVEILTEKKEKVNLSS